MFPSSYSYGSERLESFLRATLFIVMVEEPKKFEEYNRAEVCGQKVLKVEIQNLHMSITGFRFDLCPNGGNTLKVKTLQTPYSRQFETS